MKYLQTAKSSPVAQNRNSCAQLFKHRTAAKLDGALPSSSSTKEVRVACLSCVCNYAEPNGIGIRPEGVPLYTFLSVPTCFDGREEF